MTKEVKTKKIMISLTATQQADARAISKEVIGKENISGLFAFWLNQYMREKKGEK